MAILDIVATALTLGSGFIVNRLLGNPKYWNIMVVIGVYLVMTLIVHTFMKYYCKPWGSGPNPKHLIVIVTGYLGHFEMLKGIQDSFIKRYKDDELDEDIMIYLSRNVNTGFFFYTYWKSNDGINRGGMRL